MLTTKHFTTFSLLAAGPLFADLSLFRIPDTRGGNNTAYATFDGFSGLSRTNATGTTAPEQASNLSAVSLSQTTPLSFPGGLKFTTATDLRVYTFTAPVAWQLAATSTVPFQEVTLQVSELLDPSREEEGLILPGLTGHTVALSGIAPTRSSVASYLLDEGTIFERAIEITTFHWSLATPMTTVAITMNGYEDAHDSIDAFTLDLAPAPTPPTLPAPDLTVQNGQVMLSWPSHHRATLEQHTGTENTLTWETVNAPIATEGGLNTVTLPASQRSLFRLVSQ